MKKIGMLLICAVSVLSINGYAENNQDLNLNPNLNPDLNPGSNLDSNQDSNSESAAKTSRVYVYGALGTTMSHTDDAVNSAASAALTQSGQSGFTSSANPPFFYKMQAGYRIAENWAVEGGVLGTTGYGYTASGGTLAGVVSNSFKSTGLNVDMVGVLPASENIDFLVKVGGSEMRASGVSVSGQTSATQAGLTYGLGARVAVNDHLFFRADLDSYRVNPTFSSARLNFWSIGVGRSF